jgi:hypothetical protein
MPILTARVGENSAVFPDILELYVPKGGLVLDATFGPGAFWNSCAPTWRRIATDILGGRGDAQADVRSLPFPAGRFDACVFDPPYIFGAGGVLDPNINTRYRNNELKTGDWKGIGAIENLYFGGMAELTRVLRPSGVLIVKCMDLISSGKQHRVTISIWNFAKHALGMVDEDQFVVVNPHKPIMRHNYQLHARKNHSLFWVFRKK